MVELGLPYEATRRVVSKEYPKTAARLDNVEKTLEEIETAASDSEVVVISFGAPTRRQEAEGYWGSPKAGKTSGGMLVEISPTIREDGSSDWNAPQVITPVGAKIVGARHEPGYHGGYWNIDVACPA